MKATSRVRDAVHFLSVGAAFVVSIYAVSNLMPLLLQIAKTGLSLMSAVSAVGYFGATIGSVTLLARAIYRLDQRAGRIRNRVRWLER